MWHWENCHSITSVQCCLRKHLVVCHSYSLFWFLLFWMNHPRDTKYYWRNNTCKNGRACSFYWILLLSSDGSHWLKHCKHNAWTSINCQHSRREEQEVVTCVQTEHMIKNQHFHWSVYPEKSEKMRLGDPSCFTFSCKQWLCTWIFNYCFDSLLQIYLF